ncbi:MAG: hypothetical protein U9Q95_05655, partial [Candidatus Eisenbacteria bacterium]|nr:hypothetical protein [Candidatus Eisenbacteria bacterium]
MHAIVAAMVVVLAFASQASAQITLISTPDGIVQLSEEVTVTWSETVYCNLSYGRAPGTYTGETAAEGWGSLTFVPAGEGMSWGIYYCVV